MTEILFKEESYRIIGVCMYVHSELGKGFKETIYQEALQLEFNNRNIEFLSQPKIRVKFGKHQLSSHFRPDFLCYGSIIVEIKSLPFLSTQHLSQVKNYLRATNLRLGLLINFGESSLAYKRILNPL